MRCGYTFINARLRNTIKQIKIGQHIYRNTKVCSQDA